MKLLDYDTIITDLDNTIWDGYKPYFWAKLLKLPYTLQGRQVTGAGYEAILLQQDVKEVFTVLFTKNINLGFASIGGLENTSLEKQPSVILLKMFGLYDLFLYQKILVFKTERKSLLINPQGKTLYIDDSTEQLKDVRLVHGDTIDLLHRHSFKNWKDLLDGDIPFTCF
jgi:predicted phosphatase